MRREFAPKLERSQEERIINLVKRLISLLEEDPDRSDEQRITRRYSRFVQHILDAHIADLQRRRSRSKHESAPAAAHCVQKPVEKELAEVVDVQPPVEPLAQCVPNAWDELFPNQSFGPTSPLMAMTDVDYMSMLSIPEDDSLWFGSFNARF